MVNGDPVVYLKRWYEQYRWQSTRLKVWYVKKISFDCWGNIIIWLLDEFFSIPF